MNKTKIGYHWWVDDEGSQKNENFSRDIITIFNLKNYPMYLCDDKDEWNSLSLKHIEHRLYQIKYNLKNPMILNDSTLEIFGFSKQEIIRYKDFYKYDGVIYNPIEQVAPFSPKFILLFEPKKSIKNITLIFEQKSNVITFKK